MCDVSIEIKLFIWRFLNWTVFYCNRLEIESRNDAVELCDDCGWIFSRLRMGDLWVVVKGDGVVVQSNLRVI